MLGSSQYPAFGDKPENVQELTLAGIKCGPPYRWPTGVTSGAGRWLVKDGNFDASGAAYFDARRRPAIVMGEPPGNPMNTMAWSCGTTHVLVGKMQFEGVAFESDSTYPLTFKLVESKGYVYLCGRGTVTDKSGKSSRLGFEDNPDMYLPLLDGHDPVRAEAAAQALGYLAATQETKDKVVSALCAAVIGRHAEASWAAMEALGRLGDSRALPVLEKAMAQGEGTPVATLAKESIEKIEKLQKYGRGITGACTRQPLRVCW